jgi:transposase InsO family protein
MYHRQSNGKIERWHKSLKTDGIRPGQPHGLEEVRALVARFVAHDNTVRLQGAIGYITPADFLAGRGPAIWAARDAKLEATSALAQAHTLQETHV